MDNQPNKLDYIGNESEYELQMELNHIGIENEPYPEDDEGTVWTDEDSCTEEVHNDDDVETI